MTVTLELKPEIEKALHEKAKLGGFDVDVYLEKLVEKDIERRNTLDEILAPIRKNFEETGMTEDELLDFFNEIREEVYQEKLTAN